MKGKIGERLNGDLSDALNLNILIYVCTYVLTIVSTIIPQIQLFGTANFQGTKFLRALTDSIVPTTVTLILGSIIQNLVVVAKNKITRFALSTWSMLLIIAYAILYPNLRFFESWGVDIIVWFSSAVLIIFEMCAIAQVEREQKQCPSLSG